VREIGLVVLKVVRSETEIRDPQCDWNRPNGIVDPFAAEWVTVDRLVLHA
jgi:hypothetical protein